MRMTSLLGAAFCLALVGCGGAAPQAKAEAGDESPCKSGKCKKGKCKKGHHGKKAKCKKGKCKEGKCKKGKCKKGHHGMWAHGGGPLLHAPVEHLGKHLELKEEQTKQLGEIRAALKTAAAADKEAMKAGHKELRALWAGAEVPERSAVVALQTKLREARDRLAGLVLDARLKATGLLTAEQRGHLGKKGHGHGHHGKGHGKGGDDKPCPHAAKKTAE